MSWTATSDGDTIDSAWTNKIENALAVGYPVQAPDYIMFYNSGDSEYQVRNGLDGTIDMNGTNAATVLQEAIDACSAAQTVLVKSCSSEYDLGTTQIDATGVNLIGMGYQRTSFEYSGSDYAIIYDGTTTQQYYYHCGNFRIKLTDDDAKGLKLYERCHYFNVLPIYVWGNDHANNVGLLIDGGDNGCYWNNIWGFRSGFCGRGIYLDTSGSGHPNLNTFISPIIRETPASGYAFYINDGHAMRFITPHSEGTDAYTAYYVNTDDNVFINPTNEQNDGSATCWNLTATADHNRMFAPRFNCAGTDISDSGTDNQFILPVDKQYFMPLKQDVEHHTAADTLTKEETGGVHTNLGAGANVKLTLPQDAAAGCMFEFVVMTAGQQLQVDAGAAGAIYIGGAKSADNAYIWADDEGESVKLVADGNGDWVALYTQGTWTVV